jgi:hypothetical protein
MLPDYLQPDLRLVLVGTAVGEKSAAVAITTPGQGTTSGRTCTKQG